VNVDSVLFISCFLPTILLLHWLIPSERFRNALLLVAGLVFCAFGKLSGVVLLVLVAAVNYLMGRMILAGRGGRIPCVAAVIFDLAFLGFFKYLDFLLTKLLGLPGIQLGIEAPVGISFYVFKCISYIIDTWRDREQGTKHFDTLLLYISFFPQFTAGPIERFSRFQGQLVGRQRDPERIARGIRRFVVGLGKKLILAGTLAEIADSMFALTPEAMSMRNAWLGAIAYMLQIYFDFSGYSDMAIGLGQAFGFETVENFHYPYAAVSITDFWRRWHISLSSWFKDYLYIPLGGNRKGKVRTALNKALVILYCGVWHGANWTFLLWGAWHGLLSALESAGIIRAKGGFLSRCYTLLAVCLGFVMFRAETVGQGFFMLKSMFTAVYASTESTLALLEALTGEAVFVLLLSSILALPVLLRLKTLNCRVRILEPASYMLCILLFVLCLMKLASGGFAPFIYAQF